MALGEHSHLNVACLFPGQGSQTPQFLHRLPDHPSVRATFAHAAEVLDFDPLCLDSESALRSTVSVQLALLIAGVSTASALQAEGSRPDVAAGLSVGAFSAAVACGALQFPDALKLVKLRGECMERAYPHGYGMLAIDGLDERQAIAAVERVGGADAEIYIANINAPQQIVLSGANRSLQAAANVAREMGARRAERLAVSVPSHCPLLNSVAGALDAAMLAITLSDPTIAYIDNAKARLHRESAGIREDLIRNVTQTVRWHDSVTMMYERDVRVFIEMPPGRILSRLVEHAFDDARTIPFENGSLDSVAHIAMSMKRQRSE
jgi:malonate decarboxylase epsilon subunit